MKKKTLIIVGIIFVILFIAGLVTSYKDSARVRNNMEPKYAIKVITEDGNKITYWGLGYKVIRYTSVSPYEQFKSNRGVKYGSWFMNYELEDTKNKTYEGIKYEKNIDNISLELEIPNNWKYEELLPNTENDFYKYALKLYKTNEDTYAILYFHNQIFGVCGTGRTSKQISLYNGYKATIGYYYGKDIWQDISFYEMNRYIAIINYGLDKDEAEEVLDFIKTIEIIENNDKEETIEFLLKEGTITSKGATFILKNNTDKEYWYGPDYYIEIKKDGKWSEIELDSPLVWNSIAYILKANEEKEIQIDWSIGYGELSNGQYRLVKNIREEEKEDNICVYAEFEIE